MSAFCGTGMTPETQSKPKEKVTVLCGLKIYLSFFFILLAIEGPGVPSSVSWFIRNSNNTCVLQQAPTRERVRDIVCR